MDLHARGQQGHGPPPSSRVISRRTVSGSLGAAIEFQQAMAEANKDQPEDTAIVFRIGLHLGDLIVDGDDLYGDGVNVTARLEAEAPPSGIVISGDVHNAVPGRLKAAFVPPPSQLM